MKPCVGRAFVYYDSTRKTFSVRDEASRRVVLKSPVVVVTGATFRVSDKGRERVRRYGTKLVHAGVVGMASVPNAEPRTEGMTAARYDPHRDQCFVTAGGEPVTGAKRVVLAVVDGKARVWFH